MDTGFNLNRSLETFENSFQIGAAEMRDLVGAACGTQNPLVQLSQQVRGDAARQQDGLSARMSGPGPSHQAPGTFHMAPLLRETRKVEAGVIFTEI